MFDKTLKSIVFTSSVLIALGATVVIRAQQEEIENRKEYARKLKTHADLMGEAIREHYDNGGSLRLSEEMAFKIDAWVIMRDNEMV